VERLIAQHGDATDLLQALADCPRRARIHDRCKAAYSALEHLSTKPTPASSLRSTPSQSSSLSL
jgi:hypothetical protein